MLSGCMQATHYEATDTKAFKPKDKELLAKVKYENTPVAEPFRRAIVEYHRKESPGSIVVDPDNHYLYYVLDGGKAIRYGITVGEEAMAWSGIAKVGSKTEWPAWHPTPAKFRVWAYRPMSPPARTIRWAPARCTSIRGQGHAVPHPRHQPAGIYRRLDLVRLHPPDQRGRDRSL